MFGNGTISAGAISKYTVYFGTLFSDVWLKRFKGDELVQSSKVPLNYGPRDKFLARAEGNEDLERKVAIQLPRMSFELKTFYYDTTRKINPLNRILASNQTGGYNYQYQPIPYKFVYELNIMVKNIEDGLYILEQILPHFQPTWQAKLNIGDTTDTQIDVPITLNDNSHSDTYEGNFIDRRAIIWTLTFTMDAYLFQPPHSANTGIIKSIDINLYNLQNPVNIIPDEKVNVRVGQFANGAPTSVGIPLWEYSIANSTATFSPTEVINDGENIAYVASANSSFVTARNIKGMFLPNTVITSEYGSQAEIVSITRRPPESVDYNIINANSTYGTIVTFSSSVEVDNIPAGLPLLPAGYSYVTDSDGRVVIDQYGNYVITNVT